MSERERQILYINAQVWNLKDGTDKPICKAAMEMQTQSTDLRTQRGKERVGPMERAV